MTGASGQLGSYLAWRADRGRQSELVLWSRQTTSTRSGLAIRPVDLTDEQAVASALDEADPDVVIHAAAISSCRTGSRSARSMPGPSTSRQPDSWPLVRRPRSPADLHVDRPRLRRRRAWYRERRRARPRPRLWPHQGGRPSRWSSRLPGAWSRDSPCSMARHDSGRASFFDRALAALRAGAAPVVLRG